MKRRDFLALAAATISGAAALSPIRAFVQPTDEQSELFSGAGGVAFRQYVAPVGTSPTYVDDDADVTLYFDWYSVLFLNPDSAKTAFDQWSEWFDDSGSSFSEPTREKFPIGIYDEHEYGLISPESNPHGSLDMQAVWNLKGEGGKLYIGHMAMNQTGALVTIQWLHTDNPAPSYPHRISNRVNDVMYEHFSANAPHWVESVTSDLMVSLLPTPEMFVFEDGPIVSVATVEIEHEWITIGSELIEPTD